MKECSCCGDPKPPGEFGYHPKTRDRLKSWCKQCTRDQANEHYRLHKNERRAKRESQRRLTRAFAP